MNEQLLQYVICVILDIVPFIELHTLYVEDDTFFGVFVTITRSDNDIHGCQGFYDHDLQNQSSSVLLQSMQRVAHSAVRDEHVLSRNTHERVRSENRRYTCETLIPNSYIFTQRVRFTYIVTIDKTEPLKKSRHSWQQQRQSCFL